MRGKSPLEIIPVRIKNLAEYNKIRNEKIEELEDDDMGSVFNPEMHLRRISMKSVAETIAIRDDESLEREEQDLKIKAEYLENPDTIIYSVDTNRFGNLEVSLFWEEKIFLCVRYAQFYGYLLLIFFEFWPDKYQNMSEFLFLLGGQWNLIINPDFPEKGPLFGG